MNIFVVVILLWTKAGPALIDNPFTNKFDCQVAEGNALSVALKDPNINGWTVLVDCQGVPEAKKV